MNATDSAGWNLWPRGQDQWNAYAAQRGQGAWNAYAQQLAEADHARSCTDPLCCLDDETPETRPAEEASWPLLEPMSPEEEETRG